MCLSICRGVLQTVYILQNSESSISVGLLLKGLMNSVVNLDNLVYVLSITSKY